MFTADLENHQAFAYALLKFPDVWTEIIPELYLSVGFNQYSPYHTHTVYDHIIQSVIKLHEAAQRLPEFTYAIHDHWLTLCNMVEDLSDIIDILHGL